MIKQNNDMVIRHRLIDIFNKWPDKQVIFICAPAGCGKTAAVRQWLDGNGRTKAVITVDEYDNNPVHFCERFCAALRVCQPQNAALAEIVSHPSFAAAPGEFTAKAAAALSGRKHTVIVIDDLHELHDEGVLRLLPIFLKRLPETFQTVLISRDDMTHRFSDLWIKGRLAFVSGRQLLFNGEEIMLLYKKRGNSVAQEQIADIYRLTGGWAICINALLLAGGDPSVKSIDLLEEFIRLNVWEKCDEITRKFMLDTAAAEELNPSLCAALTGVADSGKLLDEFARDGVFISQTKEGAYRYHHLFRNFLKNMLKERGGAYLFLLLEKEGQWHFEQGDFYGAADCFIRCGNLEGIAKCAGMPLYLSRGYFIAEKLTSFTETPEVQAAADKYPFMFSLMSWAAFTAGKAADMISYMDKYYARHSGAAGIPAAAQSIFYARLMDFRIPLNDLANGVSASGGTPEFKDAMNINTMYMYISIPILHRCYPRDFSDLAGNDTEAAVKKVYDIIGGLFGEETKVFEESITAGLLYEQGRLDSAYAYALTANAEIKTHFSIESKCVAACLLACILDALGQPGKADKILGQFTSMIEIKKEGAHCLNLNMDALTVRRKLANGDIEAAKAWLAEYETVPCGDIKFFEIYRVFTACRAYIVCGGYDTAVILLKKMLALAQTYKRPLDIIETQILLAITYWKMKRGFQEEAIRHLEGAAGLAYGFGYTQLFVNESAGLSGMMKRLQKRAEQRSDKNSGLTSFIKMLYFKIRENQNTGAMGVQPAMPLKYIKYTDKQKKVMKLLCDGKSNKEIADIMGIKVTSLRTHIGLIYKKLGVTCEPDAVMKIKTLNIFEEL